MAYDPRVARAYNEAIAAGLSPQEAENAAGITDENAFAYVIGLDGSLQENVIGPPKRPNETIVRPGQDPEINDEDQDIFRNATVTSQSTTTTQTTQITGGGSTVRQVIPTQYEDNSTSRSLQQEANDLAAQKQARRDAIRAAGGTGADVLRDPEFSRLSSAQTAKEYEAERARTPVPNTGGIITTVTPGDNQVITEQTIDSNFVTNRSSGDDLLSQTTDANQPGFTPARSFTAGDVSADDTAAIGQFQPGTADDVPTTFGTDPLAPQLSPYGEEEEVEFQPQSSAPEPLGPDISPYGEENDFPEGEPVETFDPAGVTADDFAAVGQFQTATPDDIAPVRSPAPPLDLSYEYNEIDGYDIFDTDGNIITTVGTEQEAILYIQNAEADSIGYADQEQEAFRTATDSQLQAAQESQIQAKAAQAQAQASIRQRYREPFDGDWRVKLKLLPDATCLYKDSTNNLLAPLRGTDGVIFPYTPSISTTYNANYERQDLVHSNYRATFYKNSYVGDISIRAKFTAQDTKEAAYLLSVIHFFRSVTKMFYGQDREKGTPPPLVELSGLGQYQFNNHPCLVSTFNYNLPDDVDYIRITPNDLGVNLSQSNPKSQSSTNSGLVGSVLRVLTSGLQVGAPSSRNDLGFTSSLVNGNTQTTYVPTKMVIEITLIPTNTRKRISNDFSLRDFSNGELLKRGFW